MQLFGLLCSSLALTLAWADAAEDAASYTCSKDSPMAGNSDSFHFRGTALGGYMVLEPWITPSLFYQFLGETKPSKIGMDSSSFCKALGPKEANRQLRQHWKTWVTEDIIANLAAIGTNSLRLPVGDWMYQPYGAYPECWAGALEEVDRTLALCTQYNITVIIDVSKSKHHKPYNRNS
jgi:glucan 1,3-beta-glucosidase